MYRGVCVPSRKASEQIVWTSAKAKYENAIAYTADNIGVDTQRNCNFRTKMLNHEQRER